MTPDAAIAKARAGDLPAVLLVLGEERFVADQVVAAVRDAVAPGAARGFDEDRFVAGEADVDRVIGAARVVPMLARRRLVIVRAIDRWEPRAAGGRPEDDDGEEGGDRSRAGRGAGALDRLADYAASPVASTCMALVGTKLHGSRRLVVMAKKGGWLVPCDAVPDAALPGWIAEAARRRGHAMSPHVAESVAGLAGPDLAQVDDAVERLSLYVGPGRPIDEDAVGACVMRMRQASVWDLVDAVGRRDLGRSLAALADLFDPRDRGLRLVGLLAWSVRQLGRMDAALREGAGTDEAARRAGAPPFKARELAARVRALPAGEIERWLLVLARADLDLKGSRRPARATVEAMVAQLCGAGRSSR